jgi:hypothetical protein
MEETKLNKIVKIIVIVHALVCFLEQGSFTGKGAQYATLLRKWTRTASA